MTTRLDSMDRISAKGHSISMSIASSVYGSTTIPSTSVLCIFVGGPAKQSSTSSIYPLNTVGREGTVLIVCTSGRYATRACLLLSTSPKSSKLNSARGICPNCERYALEILYGVDVVGRLVKEDSPSESEKSSRSVITIPINDGWRCQHLFQRREGWG